MLVKTSEIEAEEAIFEMFDRLDDIYSGTNELKELRESLIIKQGESS